MASSRTCTATPRASQRSDPRKNTVPAAAGFVVRWGVDMALPCCQRRDPMRSWAILLICALLGGCASAPPPAPLSRQLLADSAFEPPSERIDAAEVFALSDAMRHYLRTDIARHLRLEGRQRGLIDALY